SLPMLLLGLVAIFLPALRELDSGGQLDQPPGQTE
ncbi:MAG: hypothetical protein QOD36_2290, partial [Mycobacterium sp.]|nr:hypothetical protein [Mycobacterium sp.]